MTWYQDEGWHNAEPQPALRPRPRRRTPSHDEIMRKVQLDTYHVRAIAEVLGEERRHTPHWEWTAEEFTAIARRQAEMKRELGA